jgi:hypothetical protein
MAEIKYAIWEGVAVRMNESEAWCCGESAPYNTWSKMNASDADSNSKLVSEESFLKMFPNLPPFPAEAFKLP